MPSDHPGPHMLDRSLLSDTTHHGIRLPLGGQFSASTQTAPSVTKTARVLLPPDSRTRPVAHTRPLTHTSIVTLGHGGTCPPAQHMLISIRTATLHRHLCAEGHPQAWDGWGYSTDPPPTHHSAISSQMPPGQTRRWAQVHMSRIFETPREIAARLGAPSSARSMPLQLACKTVATPLTLGRQLPGPLSYSVKFRVSFLKCLHSVSK